MDFLTAALFCDSPETGDDEELLLAGALLTGFDPEDNISRAKVFYVPVDELRTMRGGTLRPQGFEFTDDGVLLGDTNCRKAFERELAEYIGREFTHEVSPEPGVIDLVLLGAEYGASVVANYAGCLEGETPTLVPLRNYRVSESSLNIYCPYQTSEGKFRTHSLVDIESDTAYPSAIIVAEDSVDKFSQLKTEVIEYGSFAELSKEGKVALHVDAPFVPAPALTGEAFCNYLAYNVAYYQMGLKVLESFLEEGNYIPYQREEDSRARKMPKHNLSIKSTIKGPRVSEIVGLLDSEDKLGRYIESSLEAKMTYHWIQTILAEQHRVTVDKSQDNGTGRTMAACVSLKAMCKRRLLHFSCELLAQRLYLVNLGRFDNSIGLTLRGGGVDGFAVKKTSW